MDLDSLLKLNDAQRANALAQSQIANSLAESLSKADSTEADIPAKLAQADVLEAQAIHQQLNNLAEFLNIQWDQQAHENLIRARDLALQKLRNLERERTRLNAALREVNQLMAGEGSWDAIRNGWLGFEFIRGNLPFGVEVKAAAVKPDEGAYEREAWLHPFHGVPVALMQRDPGSLLKWARVNTLYPTLQGPAWNWIAAMLQGLGDAADKEAALQQSRVEAARQAALLIQQQDFDRLKRPTGVEGK